MRFIDNIILNQLIYANQNKYIFFTSQNLKLGQLAIQQIIILTTSMFNKTFFCYSYLLLLTFSFFHKEIHSQPLEVIQDENISKSFKVNQKQQSSSYRSARSPEVKTYLNFVERENMEKIERFNANPNRKYTLGRNPFIYLTQNEVKQRYTGLIPSQPASLKFAKALTQKQLQINIQTSNSNEVKKKSNLKASNLFLPQKLPENIQQKKSTTLAQLQKNVIQIAKNYLKRNNVDNELIQNRVIPTYRYQEDLSKIPAIYQPQTKSRLLQTIDQKGNNQIKDVDWTCISGSVKNQANCGACYAFAALDNISAILAIYFFTFSVELSAQQIIDCARNSLNFGCDGGFLQGPFAYVVRNGIYTSFNYPYTSSNYSKLQYVFKDDCRKDLKSRKFTISQFKVTPTGDCEEMKIRLQKHTLTATLATPYNFIFYKKGVIDACSPQEPISHAVHLIGYKTGKGWKIKNNWGLVWGQEGYGWLQDGNTCKICQDGAYYPIPSKKFGLEEFESGKPLKMCPAPK